MEKDSSIAVLQLIVAFSSLGVPESPLSTRCALLSCLLRFLSINDQNSWVEAELLHGVDQFSGILVLGVLVGEVLGLLLCGVASKRLYSPDLLLLDILT